MIDIWSLKNILSIFMHGTIYLKICIMYEFIK